MRQLLKGNEAIAEAAIRAGLDAYFGYPITPQTELLEHMARRMPELGRAFVQAESEIAAINMVYGAACAGKRAMTSSSGPGISLMQEGLSYIAASQVPAVLVDVMRGGPGLGNIAASQADYFQMTKSAGHGDFRPIVLAPATVQEAIDLTVLAFDLAEQYRTLVTLLLDGNLGQLMEPAELPPMSTRPARVSCWALGGAAQRPKRLISSFNLQPEALEADNRRLQDKIATIAAHEVRAYDDMLDDAEIVVIGFGTAGRIAQSAVRAARAQGIKAGLLRPITLAPFPDWRVSQLAGQARAFLVVEMNAGQMLEDVKLAAAGHVPVRFYGRMGGTAPLPDEILDAIVKLGGGQ
ncbi:MAG: 3-methyl-2-oxobutanoate dehydrogenase subunit VorB [Kouleothrix sp.]|jgi:2-oxoglutarate ferredoxin oxidoreductase subunit alpha|nr:3-methyl-2-oxobutanoate dehydrogenase subunit VorB [Kouleothrix sp.]